MRMGGDALLAALSIGGLGAPWVSGTVDVFAGSENGMNSGEIPLNLALAGIPSVATIAMGKKVIRDIKEMENTQKAARGIYAAEFATDLEDRIEKAARLAKIRELQQQGQEGTARRLQSELLRDKLRAEEEMVKEKRYAEALEGVSRGDELIARARARGVGKMAAVAAGLGIPIAGYMGMDWMNGAPAQAQAEIS